VRAWCNRPWDSHLKSWNGWKIEIPSSSSSSSYILKEGPRWKERRVRYGKLHKHESNKQKGVVSCYRRLFLSFWWNIPFSTWPLWGCLISSSTEGGGLILPEIYWPCLPRPGYCV
jgi:hypothetical protein